jgi:hypothetical protein
MVATLTELKLLSQAAADIYSTAEAGKQQSKARAVGRLFSNKSTHTKDMNAVEKTIMPIKKIDETISMITSTWADVGIPAMEDKYTKSDKDAVFFYNFMLKSMAQNLTDVILKKYPKECQNEASFAAFIDKLNQNPNEHHYARIIGLLLLKVSAECEKAGIKAEDTRSYVTKEQGLNQGKLLAELKKLETKMEYGETLNSALLEKEHPNHSNQIRRSK